MDFLPILLRNNVYVDIDFIQNESYFPFTNHEAAKWLNVIVSKQNYIRPEERDKQVWFIVSDIMASFSDYFILWKKITDEVLLLFIILHDKHLMS